MLPRENRLPRSRFGLVKKEGRLIRSEKFGILVYERGDTDLSRIAFVVSKKVNKRAVVRNRTRRLFREAVRSLLGKLGRGVDIVFLVKPASVGVELKKLAPEVEKTFKKAKLL